MKKLIVFTLALVVVANLLASCKKKPVQFDDIDFSAVSADSFQVTDEETDYVLLDVADYGQILIRLYPDVAPGTVKNFKKLVSEKFYDGLSFHRVATRTATEPAVLPTPSKANSPKTAWKTTSSTSVASYPWHDAPTI